MFACLECGNEYSVKETLKRHLKSHAATAPYPCPECDIPFSRKDLLTRHSRIHLRAREALLVGSTSSTPVSAGGRIRARKACDNCASRRSKCNGGTRDTEACWRCASEGCECTYNRTPLARSRTRSPLRVRPESLVASVLSNTGHDSDTQMQASASTPPWLNALSLAHPRDGAAELSIPNPPYIQPLPQSQPSDISVGPSTINIALPTATLQDQLLLAAAHVSHSRDESSFSVSGSSGASALPTSDTISNYHATPKSSSGMEWLANTLSDQNHLDEGLQFADHTQTSSQTSNWDWLLDENIAPTYTRSSSPTHLNNLHLPYDSFLYPINASMLFPESATTLSSGSVTSQPQVDNESDAFPTEKTAAAAAQIIEQGQGSTSTGTIDQFTPSSGCGSTPTIGQRDPLAIQLAPTATSALDTESITNLCAQFVVDKIITFEIGSGITPADLIKELDLLTGNALFMVKPSTTSGTSPFGETPFFTLCVRLYFAHFQSLWPLACPEHFHPSSVSPPLYLAVCIIGAMYGEEDLVLFGRSLHEAFRARLITRSMDLKVPNQPSYDSCLTLLLNQIAALYFGHKRSFYVAQQLGVSLHTQARRLGLFDEDQWPSPTASKWERPVCSKSESYRRLALGIYRVDVYVALLLGTRPIVSPQELRISTLPQETWQCDSGRDDNLKRNGIAVAQPQYYTDLIETVLDADDSLPALHALDLELVLMGIAHETWRIDQERFVFHRLYGEHHCVAEVVRSYDRGISLDTKSASSVRTLGHIRPALAPTRRHWSACVSSLRKWSVAFTATLRSPSLRQDRSRILSCRILYHLLLLQTYSSINTLANSAHLPDAVIPAKIVIWLKSEDCMEALQHATSLYTLVSEEMQAVVTERANFNLLTFVSLHHAAAVISMALRLRASFAVQQDHIHCIEFPVHAASGPLQFLKVIPSHRESILRSFVSLLQKCDVRWLIATNFASAVEAMIPIPS